MALRHALLAARSVNPHLRYQAKVGNLKAETWHHRTTWPLCKNWKPGKEATQAQSMQRLSRSFFLSNWASPCLKVVARTYLDDFQVETECPISLLFRRALQDKVDVKYFAAYFLRRLQTEQCAKDVHDEYLF